MVVESFSLLPQDLTANVQGTSRFDQNTRKNAALIKIETTQKGFVFEGGSLGFVGDPEYKTGEIWLYVPEGAKKLTLKHETLGILRDYYYGISIQSGKTYLMKLKTGKVITHIEQDYGGDYLTLIVEPKNSEVLIDGKTIPVDAEGGVSTFLTYGDHQYEVSANMYKREVGNITISGGAVKKNITLAPDYSILQINTNPQGATVYIDDVNSGTTPLKTSPIKSGEHILRFTLPMYTPKTVTHTVIGSGATQTITETLQPDFSTVTITAPEQAEIYINNEKKGSGKWEGKLLSGTYLLEARKPSHRPYKTSITVESGKTQTIAMQAPTPQYGAINIQSTPTNAMVYIDGKEIGTTPGIFKNILIGEREVTIKKEGYSSVTNKVTIEEGKTTPKEFSLTKKTEQQPIAVTQSKENKTTTKDFTETINGLNLQMVYVEGGTFTMGATPEQGSDAYNNEKPSHKVTLSSYYIGKYEVTQAQWRAIMGENPSYFTGDNNPVEKVSWYEAQEFCKKLSQLTGKKYRLPTEAEWEYAARGGKKSKGYKYSGSNTIGDVAWYDLNSGRKTHPIGQKQPNELGIYDMSGNVHEWCYDWYSSSYYSSSPQTNPKGAASGSDRVNRGGSWYSNAGGCRLTIRFNYYPGSSGSNLGLRVVCEVENNEAINVSTNNKVNTHNAHEYVDLGLSVKWATCNVGADSPEEYGDYFAWGETTPKTTYNWSTYKYCNGSSSTMTKYCIKSSYGTVDNKTTLELTDDAARVNWGGKWRMPTRAEQDELRNTSNCTWTWTTQNGVKGYKVTSKKNGNSIFLPAAGCRIGGSLYDAGSDGYYWSSSLNADNGHYACYLLFDSDYVVWYDNYRYYGRCVRAVCE